MVPAGGRRPARWQADQSGKVARIADGLAQSVQDRKWDSRSPLQDPRGSGFEDFKIFPGFARGPRASHPVDAPPLRRRGDAAEKRSEPEGPPSPVGTGWVGALGLDGLGIRSGRVRVPWDDVFGRSRRVVLRGSDRPRRVRGRSAPVGRDALPPRAVRPGDLPQGSSAFFWEIKRRTRSASSAPSNGFLKASLKPSAKVSSPGSSLVRASRIVP
jgi:hypothetical protein